MGSKYRKKRISKTVKNISKKRKATQRPKSRLKDSASDDSSFEDVHSNSEKEISENEYSSAISSDEEKETYEKVPRVKKSVKVRNLLPVKNKSGVIYRSEIIPDEESAEENDSVDEAPVEKSIKRNLVEDVAEQRVLLNELKKKVALLCTSVIEDPNKSLPALKELVSMFQNSSTKFILSEKKVLCLSLLNVFIDIIPDYRIRPQEEDPKVMLKKETKKLLGFEMAVLKQYKKYLNLLYNLIRKMATNQSKTASATKKRVSYEVGRVALKCMCELLKTKYHFNCFRDICQKLVPLAFDGDEIVSTTCCQAFESLFKSDTRGEGSYNLVNQIVDIIKSRKFQVPVCLLKTFLCLNLREAKKEKVEKVDMRKGREEWRKNSRSQRFRKKHMAKLEAELKEVEANENYETIKKFHTQTLLKIYWVYFHILKDGDKKVLIAPALEGLSQFTYLLNLDFFADLTTVLCNVMENQLLSNVEKLHGAYTLFTILAGQAQSLSIDPYRIYRHLYQGLLELGLHTNVEHFKLAIKTIEFNIVRKAKVVSLGRILAFLKRLCTVCLQTPVHGTLGLLSSVRKILTTVKGCDVLLDSENMFGSGFYYPEMEDPEYCNARSTALWELHLLRKHFNPAIKLYGNHLLHNCSNQGRSVIPAKLISADSVDVVDIYTDIALNNKMEFLQDVTEPPKKKFKVGCSPTDSFCENINTEIDMSELDQVDFFQSLCK